MALRALASFSRLVPARFFSDVAEHAGRRITSHPVLKVPKRKEVMFSWNGQEMPGFEGEALSSAIIANGFDTFGHHPKDGSPQGIFCANGQCSQCMVVVDGRSVKSCMTPLKAGMTVQAADSLPKLPEIEATPKLGVSPSDRVKEVDVLVVGGGPAGISAATQLGERGIKTLLVDDKDRLGGKLVLQTHKFFGTKEDAHAGTRGFEIAKIIEKEMRKNKSVDVWLNSNCVGVFSDGLVGIQHEDKYELIKPKRLLVATGAREKSLASFKGNTLPGVYGAGAFQTLVNRDLVRCSERLLIVGGGNVGLIAAYHAMQAGIHVVGLIEGADKCGGYAVHEDKIKRLGVNVMTRHTIVEVHGKDRVEAATIAAVDDKFRVIPGTEKTYEVDTVLLAVGLERCNEFQLSAIKYGVKVFAAGDADEVAEASAAMFGGKIKGVEIATSLGLESGEIPADWLKKEEILKYKGGDVKPENRKELPAGSPQNLVKPIMHCVQEIPCNACVDACDLHMIKTMNDPITGLPYFAGWNADDCEGCYRCVATCPGLAVTVVDSRENAEMPLVSLPWELPKELVEPGQEIAVMDREGKLLGRFPVEACENKKGCNVVSVRVPKDLAEKVAGVWKEDPQPWTQPTSAAHERGVPDDAVVCRCERVTAGELRALIRKGVRDENQLKAQTRIGMGACQSKTCHNLVQRLFREEKVDMKDMADRVYRPLYVEVPLGTLSGVEN